MKKSYAAWLVLLAITLIAALALAFTNAVTKDPIAEQERLKAEKTRQELLPDAAEFKLITEEGEQDVYEGVDAAGNAVGYVSVGTVLGFGGQVEVTVGMDREATLTGVRVGGANFSETAGLGAKSKNPAFYNQFAGKSYPVALSKNGGEIDAITAATITSSAVVRGVNETAKYIAEKADIKLAEPVVAIEELGDNRYGTTGQGVSGPFPVVVTLDGSGAVVSVEVQDTSAANDIGFLAKVQGNEAYLGQFAGKTAVDAAALDTVSGATVSSKSVNEAVSKILLYVNDPAAYAAQVAAAADVPDVAIPEGAATFTAEGKGLTGTFPVTISVDENGAVNGIEIGDASTDQDVPFLGQVKNNAAFLAQFIGTAGNVNADEIDIVSGATASSKGVANAVNEAWKASQGITEEPAAAEPAAETPSVAIPEGAKTYAAEGKGLTGTFPVTVSVDENGAVSGIEIGESTSGQDEMFLGQVRDNADFLKQFIGVAGSIDADAIDVVSGATASSKGVANAVNEALKAGLAPAEETPAEPEAPAAEPETPAAEPAADAGKTYTAEGKGLTGTFPVTVSIDGNGAVSGIEIGESTSGQDEMFLGQVRDNADFLKQFIGAAGSIDADAIDVVSGATASSKGVANAVNEALKASQAPAEETPAEPEAPAAEPTADTGKTYAADGQGLTGTFPVTITVDENGAVSTITIGESTSAQDEAFLGQVRDNADFLKQFIGATGSVDADAIDVVSGATASSKGVANAVNEALKAGQASAEETSAEPEAPAAEPATDAGRTYTADGQGLTGTFPVTVSIDGNGVVSGIEIGESTSAQDEAFLGQVRDNADFLKQFIGATGSVDADAIDVVSGATASSKGVANAVNEALNSK